MKGRENPPLRQSLLALVRRFENPMQLRPRYENQIYTQRHPDPSRSACSLHVLMAIYICILTSLCRRHCTLTESKCSTQICKKRTAFRKFRVLVQIFCKVVTASRACSLTGRHSHLQPRKWYERADAVELAVVFLGPLRRLFRPKHARGQSRGEAASKYVGKWSRRRTCRLRAMCIKSGGSQVRLASKPEGGSVGRTGSLTRNAYAT